MSRSLTEILMEKLSMEPESDAEAASYGDTLQYIREATKEWLAGVDCSPFLSEERMRSELIKLVDEP